MKLNVSRRFGDNDKFAGAGVTTTKNQIIQLFGEMRALLDWSVFAKEPMTMTFSSAFFYYYYYFVILAYIFDINI